MSRHYAHAMKIKSLGYQTDFIFTRADGEVIDRGQADEGYHAAKIYESVGFIPLERLVGVCMF